MKATTKQTASDSRPFAALRVRKIVEDFVPLHRTGTQSIGGMIEEQIEEAALNFSRIQELAVVFEDEDWSALAADIRHRMGTCDEVQLAEGY